MNPVDVCYKNVFSAIFLFSTLESVVLPSIPVLNVVWIGQKKKENPELANETSEIHHYGSQKNCVALKL